VPPPRPTSAVVAAEAELAGRDSVLAGLIGRCGPCLLRPRLGGRGHFEALARVIVYQQLAGRAAEAIWGRVRALVAGRFTPAAVRALPERSMRAAGLSGAKARSLLDLADRAASGELRLDRLARLPDEGVVTELSRVRGVGPWTADMFLLFQLGRLDVWPTSDLGVRKGFAMAWGEPAVPSPDDLDRRGVPDRPRRTGDAL
jgi:DNA-3-methyladenine glycosylase II